MGFIQYTAQALRPDVAHAANQLAQAQHLPRSRHLSGAIHCLRYLKGTAHLALCYQRNEYPHLVGFTDSDFAGCQGKRRSTTGWIFGISGSPVSWKSKKQECLTNSSCEAEYMAITSGTKECNWLRDLMTDCGAPPTYPTAMYCDNEASVRITKDPICQSRTKHCSLAFWYVREQQEKGIIHVIPVGTQQQLADHLTKSLGKDKHWWIIHSSGQAKAPADGAPRKGE